MRAITISSFLFVNQAFSQHPQLLSEEGWELKKEKYDVQVFAKPIEGYKIKGFRASGFVAAKPETVYNVIIDIKRYDDWYPDCKEGFLLQKVDEKAQYQSIEYQLPWPFDPRDAVNKIECTKSDAGILINIINASEFLEEKKKIVRIPRSEGYWLLIPEKEGTKVIYSAIGEAPGVPAWVVNLFRSTKTLLIGSNSTRP